LELHISELEAETERLSRSHEAQKKVSSDAQEVSIRKISDIAKELQKKVR
jgi:homeobox protein cut-like